MSGRAVWIWDNNFREKDIENVRHGDVIIYSNIGALDSYLIVERVEGDIIHGNVAFALPTTSVPVRDIVDACGL